MYNDDIFNYIRKIFEEFKAQEQNIRESFESGDFRSGKPITWGYSFSVGPDGVPKIKTFNNTPNLNRNLAFNDKTLPTEGFDDNNHISDDGYRIPHTDLIDDDNLYRLIVELPGIEKENIEVKAKNNSLSIKAENENFKYKKNMPFNFKTIPTKIKSSFKNGILELVIPIDSKNEDEGQNIKVE